MQIIQCKQQSRAWLDISALNRHKSLLNHSSSRYKVVLVSRKKQNLIIIADFKSTVINHVSLALNKWLKCFRFVKCYSLSKTKTPGRTRRISSVRTYYLEYLNHNWLRSYNRPKACNEESNSDKRRHSIPSMRNHLKALNRGVMWSEWSFWVTLLTTIWRMDWKGSKGGSKQCSREINVTFYEEVIVVTTRVRAVDIRRNGEVWEAYSEKWEAMAWWLIVIKG